MYLTKKQAREEWPGLEDHEISNIFKRLYQAFEDWKIKRVLRGMSEKEISDSFERLARLGCIEEAPGQTTNDHPAG